jgi:Holliday junction resolvase RusA-like endonuclease
VRFPGWKNPGSLRVEKLPSYARIDTGLFYCGGSMTFRFFGELISGNHRNKYSQKTGRYFHDKKYNKFLNSVKAQWLKQNGIMRPVEWMIEVKVNIYRHRRAGDADGFLKTIFDSLNGLAYSDDAQIKRGSFEIFDDKKNPGFEINISLLRQSETAEKDE